MNPEISTALAGINRVFYTKFAGDFARTRQSWPLGYERILPHFEPGFNVLDVGCGNARLASFLAERGWHGRYVGLDASAGLLAEAQATTAGLAGVDASFVQADLLDADWSAAARAALASAALAPGGLPQVITALAVLHHIPGAVERARFLAACATLLPPAGGTLIVSTWQFLSAPRLAGHILPWSTVGLREEDVEPGDYLLSWGQNQAGVRYCAAIGSAELAVLAAQANLTLAETFTADGKEGDLNLYGVLMPSPG